MMSRTSLQMLTFLMTRILGIDPGSRIMGFGVIDIANNKEAYIASGCIKLDTSLDFIERIGQILPAVETIIVKHQPTAMVIEQVFLAKNANSALKLGHARGIAIAAAHKSSLAIFEYSARAIKQAVVGTGAANKDQVGFMVQQRLSLASRPQVDAADALAVALTHAQSILETI